MTNEKTQKENSVQAQYGRECTLPKEDFIKTFGIKENGLTSEEAEERLNKYGFNEISSHKPKKWYHYFFQSLFTPFNCILLRNCFNLILY